MTHPANFPRTTKKAPSSSPRQIAQTSHMASTTARRCGSRPSQPEQLLLGSALVLRLSQTGVIQRGVTYHQICEAAMRNECTFTDHTRGVRPQPISLVCAALACAYAIAHSCSCPLMRPQMGTYIMDYLFEGLGSANLNGCAHTEHVLSPTFCHAPFSLYVCLDRTDTLAPPSPRSPTSTSSSRSRRSWRRPCSSSSRASSRWPPTPRQSRWRISAS